MIAKKGLSMFSVLSFYPSPITLTVILLLLPVVLNLLVESDRRNKDIVRSNLHKFVG
jgi:hypothetical protein